MESNSINSVNNPYSGINSKGNNILVSGRGIKPPREQINKGITSNQVGSFENLSQIGAKFPPQERDREKMSPSPRNDPRIGYSPRINLWFNYTGAGSYGVNNSLRIEHLLPTLANIEHWEKTPQQSAFGKRRVTTATACDSVNRPIKLNTSYNPNHPNSGAFPLNNPNLNPLAHIRMRQSTNHNTYKLLNTNRPHSYAPENNKSRDTTGTRKFRRQIDMSNLNQFRQRLNLRVNNKDKVEAAHNMQEIANTVNNSRTEIHSKSKMYIHIYIYIYIGKQVIWVICMRAAREDEAGIERSTWRRRAERLCRHTHPQRRVPTFYTSRKYIRSAKEGM